MLPSQVRRVEGFDVFPLVTKVETPNNQTVVTLQQKKSSDIFITKRSVLILLLSIIGIAIILLFGGNWTHELYEKWNISLSSYKNHSIPVDVSNTLLDFSFRLSAIKNKSLKELPTVLQTFKLHQMFTYEMSKISFEKQNQTFTISYILKTLTELYKSESNSKINFIQIGACDADFSGKGYSDIFQNYAFNNDIYYGILIEPVPSVFANLQKNVKKYIVPQNVTDRFVLLNSAFSASGSDENATFYKVNTDKFLDDLGTGISYLHSWLYQLGSFSIEHVKEHLSWRKGLKHEPDYYIDQISVQSYSANTIYNTIGKSQYNIFARDGTLDIVQIDAEGFDANVVKGFINADIFPLIFIYENKHIDATEMKNVTELLSKYGYINFKDGPNSFAVRFYNLKSNNVHN